MKLHEMKSTPGSRGTRKRVGRGTGSGWGKTAGRGENGQKSRSGFKNKIGFEGGQNPLYKRIPKRGFNNINRVDYTIINVEKIQSLGLSVITPEILIENGVIKNSYGLLKVLGNGELSTAVEVTAHKFSASAVKAIEAAGGKVTVISDDKAPVAKSAKKTAAPKKAAAPKVEAEEVLTAEETAEFAVKTVVELKELAKTRGIEGISKMKKADLVEALKNA